MNYEMFSKILNKHIFEDEKKELLKKLAEKPERFIGLFRPTKPYSKILQYLLQSHEIRFGDAMEELISELLREWGFKILPKIIFPDPSNPKKKLNIDQYFTDGNKFYFIEQKVRDDHDSTKKRGQIHNFETKLKFLYKKHGKSLVGILYFIDPNLSKNKNYYLEKLKNMENFYGVRLHLLYGKDFFSLFKKEKCWEDILNWLSKWKREIPELPEINFDRNPQNTFYEIKDLEIKYWRKILENKKLWDEGIIYIIFGNGSTLKLLLRYFNSKPESAYQKLSLLLKQRIKEYFIRRS